MTVANMSLWPTEFDEPVLLTPLAILRQQGAALGEQTKNIVVGRVATNSEGESFEQVFSLYCPPLGFQTDIIRVTHGIDLYPAHVFSLVEGVSPQTASGPEKLQAILKELFAGTKTRKIIASLLAQSRQ